MTDWNKKDSPDKQTNKRRAMKELEPGGGNNENDGQKSLKWNRSRETRTKKSHRMQWMKREGGRTGEKKRREEQEEEQTGSQATVAYTRRRRWVDNQLPARLRVGIHDTDSSWWSHKEMRLTSQRPDSRAADHDAQNWRRSINEHNHWKKEARIKNSNQTIKRQTGNARRHITQKKNMGHRERDSSKQRREKVESGECTVMIRKQRTRQNTERHSSTPTKQKKAN